MEETNNNQNPIKDNKPVINRLRSRNPSTGKLNPVKRPIRGVLTKSGYRYSAEAQKGTIKSGRTAILVVTIIIAVFALIAFIQGMSGISDGKKILANTMKSDSELAWYSIETLEQTINIMQIGVILNLSFSLFIAGIYIVLWFVARKRPFPALLTALIIYSLFWLINIIMNPMAILAGAIQFLILFYLIYGVRAAHRYKKFLKQAEEQNASLNSELAGNSEA